MVARSLCLRDAAVEVILSFDPIESDFSHIEYGRGGKTCGGERSLPQAAIDKAGEALDA